MKQIGDKGAKFGYITADMFKFENEAAKIIQVNLTNMPPARKELLISTQIVQCNHLEQCHIICKKVVYVPQLQKAVTSLGGLDHVVLNHAYMVTPESYAVTGWNGSAEQLQNTRDQFDVGFFSYLHLTAHALPHLKASTSARISIVGSMAGKTNV